MLIRSATILCLFAAVATTVARCATIKQREIPVEIRYEDKTKGENSIRNLDEKIQLSPEEEKQTLKLEEAKTTEEPASPNNLDANLPQKDQEPLEEPKQQQPQLLEEKLQLPEKKLEETQPPQQLLEEKPQQQQQEEEPLLPSSEKPAQPEPTLQPEQPYPLRHLPADVDEPKQPKEEKPVEVKKLEEQPKPEISLQKEAEPTSSPQPPPPPQQQPLQEEPKPTQQPQEEKPLDPPAPASASSKSLPEEPKIQEPNPESILQQAQKIVTDGLQQLRESFKPEKDEQAPKPEQWESLEKSINQFFDEEKNKILTKQEQPAQPAQPAQPQQPQQSQNIFQTIAGGIQSAATTFVQNLPGSGNPQGQGDEGANQNGFQAFVAAFQGGISNMINNINSLGGQSPSNTVLGDEAGASSQAPPTGGPAGVFSNIVSNVQQFIGNNWPNGGQGAAQQGGAAAAQGDTGTAPENNQNAQQGPFQAIQQIGSAVGQFFQGGNKPAQGDEGTGATQAPNFFQSFGNVVQNIINPSNQGSSPQNPIQAGIQQVQSQVQNQLNPSSEAPAVETKQEPEQPQPEQAQPEQKQPEQKKPEQILPEQIQLDQKQPEQIQPEQPLEKKGETSAQ